MREKARQIKWLLICGLVVLVERVDVLRIHLANQAEEGAAEIEVPDREVLAVGKNLGNRNWQRTSLAERP